MHKINFFKGTYLSVHRFVQRILNNPSLKVEEQSQMVHDFYGVSVKWHVERKIVCCITAARHVHVFMIDL